MLPAMLSVKILDVVLRYSYIESTLRMAASVICQVTYSWYISEGQMLGKRASPSG